MRARIIGVAVVFLVGAVFGAVVTNSDSDTGPVSTPRPTVTETVTVEVTKEVLSPECEEAMNQAEVVLDAALAVSANQGGLGQIISDSKRYIALDDVAGLSEVQVRMEEYQDANAEAFHALGIEANTLDEAIATCKTD